MVQVILIKPNKYNIEKIIKKKTKNQDLQVKEENLLKLKYNYVDLDKMKEELKDIIQVIDVQSDKDGFMKDICQLINLDEFHYGDVIDCYEDKTNIYQLFHVIPTQDDNLDKLPPNVLSASISYKKELLYNNLVLFKTNLPLDSKTANVVDVTFNELIGLIMNNFYFAAVYIDKDNSIKQTFFDRKRRFVDPLTNFSFKNYGNILNNNTSYGIKENSLFKFNLSFVFNDKNTSDPINNPVGRLLKEIVRGDCCVVSPYNEYNYYDLSKESFINILRICDKHILNDQDCDEERNEDNTYVIKNKYRILHSKLNA